MRIGAATDVTELLRSLPDMQPPADAWTRIRVSQRRGHPLVWSGAALAACAALVVFVLLTREEVPVVPVETYLVRAEAPVVQVPARVDMHELRRRSQRMERMLRDLPPRTQLVRADVAGAITELQDRIAVVDYELNRTVPGRPAPARNSIVRWPSANDAASARWSRSAAPSQHDLWRERVDLMDRLVRVRYAEAGAEAY